MAEDGPSHRPEDGVHFYEMDGTESACEAVISAVSAVSGRESWPDPGADTSTPALDPLYTVLDPDALNHVVASLADGRVSFDYAGYRVTVDSNGGIEVADALTDG